MYQQNNVFLFFDRPEKKLMNERMNRGKMPLLLTSFLIEKKVIFFLYYFYETTCLCLQLNVPPSYYMIIKIDQKTISPKHKKVKRNLKARPLQFSQHSSKTAATCSTSCSSLTFCHIVYNIYTIYTISLLALLELGLPNKAHFKGHAGPAAFVSIDKRNCQSTLKKKDFQQGHGIIVVVRPFLRSAFSTCGIQKAGPSAGSTYSESKQTAA